MRMTSKPPKRTARASKPARTRRQATNLTVRVELVRRAKALKLNLSNVLETALVAAIREREQKGWLADNAEAIDAANRHMEQHGLFSETWRPF